MRMTLVLVLVLDPSRKVRCTMSGIDPGQLRHRGVRMSAAVGMENMEKKLDVVEKAAIRKISELTDMENKMDNSKNLSTTVPEQYTGVVVTSILQYGKSR